MAATTVSTLVGVLNVFLGLIYLSYGLMTIDDLRKGWSTRGWSHFGLAWIAMAFTCGPHHLEHGIHVLTTDQLGGGLDLLSVAIGLPAGLVWFLLRVEARRGGLGDRTVSGTPTWLEQLPTLAAVYVLAFATGSLLVMTDRATFDPRLLPNIALVGLYAALGWVLGRTQVRAHRQRGGWSLSGVSLALVFPTCALMHASWVVYVSSGRYAIDPHLLVIDTISVPAAAYFLWVMSAIGTGRLQDWNRAAADARAPEPEPVTTRPR